MTELDIENAAALTQYLRDAGRVASDEQPSIRVLAGGVSNKTVLVTRHNEHAEAWVIKQALAKLRVQVDWFCDPMRIHREALGLRSLQQLVPAGRVPQFLFEDHQQHLFAMSAVREPHDNWKTRLLAGQVDVELVRQAATMLGALHRGSHDRAAEYADLFEDRSFFEALRLEPYYAYAAEQVRETRPFLSALIDETRRNRVTLVHGDFSPKNLLVHKGELVLLDHEVIHWGDPAFDVGFFMTHLLSKAHHVSTARNAFVAAACEFWQVYSRALGDDDWQRSVAARAVRHTLACLLARVAGRSPLEYLDVSERLHQQQVVLALMSDVPPTMEQLTDQFVERLESLADH